MYSHVCVQVHRYFYQRICAQMYEHTYGSTHACTYTHLHMRRHRHSKGTGNMDFYQYKDTTRLLVTQTCRPHRGQRSRLLMMKMRMTMMIRPGPLTCSPSRARMGNEVVRTVESIRSLILLWSGRTDTTTSRGGLGICRGGAEHCHSFTYCNDYPQKML